MSARTALEKLRRNRLNGKTHLPIGRPAHTRPLEEVAVPPGTETHLVCDDWPECQCDGDCSDPPGSASPGWIRLAWPLLISLALAGAWIAIIGGHL